MAACIVRAASFDPDRLPGDVATMVLSETNLQTVDVRTSSSYLCSNITLPKISNAEWEHHAV